MVERNMGSAVTRGAGRPAATLEKAGARLGDMVQMTGDAAHMRSDHHSGRTWGKKGETPVVLRTGAR